MGFENNEFRIVENSIDREKMRFSESIMSIGNEYMGMRGNFEEKYSGDSLKGVYIGGVWYPDKTRVGWWKNGYPEYFGKMINSPNFIGINVKIDGKELDLNKEEVKSFRRELDMENGVLSREFTIDRNGNLFEIRAERFVSIDTKEICAIKYQVKALTSDAEIEFEPYIDADISNEDSNYDEKFWDVLNRKADKEEAVLIAQTKPNNFGVERFTVCYNMKSKVDGEITVKNETEKFVSQNFRKKIEKGETASIEKIISVVTSRDEELENLSSKGREILKNAFEEGFDKLKEKHSAKWHERWSIADVVIKNNTKLQQGIRYNIFQLFSTYYGEDFRLNIGPKGFTGEKYGGATYWDTEAYIVPMYLSVAPENVTKNLLKYRFNQLEQAYHNAGQQGLDGALYPMVTFNGIECHNEWEITFEEIHRNGAIAYAIYNYVNYTGDYEYISQYGIDVLVGISRFWADRVHFSKRCGKYMIHGVTGPNEYDNNVNNNWYTNTIAAWTLTYTMDMMEKISTKEMSDKLEKLKVNLKEISRWKDIVENMYYPYDEELGVFVQHDTFLDKDLMTVDEIEEGMRPLNQNWSWDKILRSCFIKQADVLQGMYLFDHKFSKEEIKRNYEFYEPMTVHESSLSACIHSILACEIGKEDKAEEMYERTARLDLDNYNNDTDDGLHITSMSGGWLSIVHGFAGMRTYGETLRFSPLVPKNWDGYSFNINYRNRLIKVDTDRENLRIELKKGDKLNIKVYEKDYSLEDVLEIKLERAV